MMGRLETMITAPSQVSVFGVKAPAAQDFGSIFAAALATPAEVLGEPGEVLGEPGEDQHDGDAPKDPRVAQHPSTEATPAIVPTVHQFASQLAHHGVRHHAEALVASGPDMEDSTTVVTFEEALDPSAAPAAAPSLPAPSEEVIESQPNPVLPNVFPSAPIAPVGEPVADEPAINTQAPIAAPVVPAADQYVTVPASGSMAATAALSDTPVPRAHTKTSRSAEVALDAVGPNPIGVESSDLIAATTPQVTPAAAPIVPAARATSSAPVVVAEASQVITPAPVASVPTSVTKAPQSTATTPVAAHSLTAMADAPAVAIPPVPVEAPARVEATPAPARAEQPRLEAPPTPEQVRQVHRQLAAPAIHMATSAEGIKTMTIRLHPEELGQITVVARLQGTNTHIELVPGADTSRELVRAILPELRRDLANHHAEASLDLNEEPDRQEPEHSRHESKITKATAGEKLPTEPDATHQTRGAGRLDISA